MVQCKKLSGMGVALVIGGLIWMNYVLPVIKSAPESLNFDIPYAELWGSLMFWSGVAMLITSGIIVAYRKLQR